ncbi:MAG: SirB2 family protein [Pseudomonadota bacterium]
MSEIAVHYPLLKQLHISTVVISGMLFVLRYFWMLRDSLQDRAGWVRTVPHINDTILLVSGLTMASIIQQYPLLDAWLSAKFFALLSYIIFGSIALKRGRSKQIRKWAGPLAIVCYLYIISTALSRSPLPSVERILQVFTY